MITSSNFVILGAAGRNVGKTEFACELIARYSKRENVVGVKITTIQEKDGMCPRGGAGCGVCSSLKGNYMITEETCGSKGKDTVRMLEAGADKVFWLRVLKEHLSQGVQELLTKIPDDACVVCESNSSREVLEPGVFLVIQERGTDSIKPSCRSVIGYADRLVEFDNNSWDIQPDTLSFEQGTWSITTL